MLRGAWDRCCLFFFSSSRRHTVLRRDWSSDVCSSDLKLAAPEHVTGDLSGLVLGKFSGRDQPTDRTAFIFRGHALGDLALAALAYRKFNDVRAASNNTGPFDRAPLIRR